MIKLLNVYMAKNLNPDLQGYLRTMLCSSLVGPRVATMAFIANSRYVARDGEAARKEVFEFISSLAPEAKEELEEFVKEQVRWIMSTGPVTIHRVRKWVDSVDIHEFKTETNKVAPDDSAPWGAYVHLAITRQMLADLSKAAIHLDRYGGVKVSNVDFSKMKKLLSFDASVLEDMRQVQGKIQARCGGEPLWHDVLSVAGMSIDSWWLALHQPITLTDLEEEDTETISGGMSDAELRNALKRAAKELNDLRRKK